MTSYRMPRKLAGFALVGALTVSAAPLAAQTDYYNTDKGRPIQVEDAYPTERYAFELQLAPLRLERARRGVYNWGVEPELAYGIFPRTHVEIGAPLAYVDVAGTGPVRRSAGLAGIDLSVLHNFNVETHTLPALGLVGEVLLPAGGLGPDKAYASAKGLLTRTYRWARFHVNTEYTFGSAPAQPSAGGAETVGPGVVELSRWLAGVAVDKTYPLRSMLITAEVYARQPIHADEELEWNTGAGIRYQLTPYFALDGGAGVRFAGSGATSWFATFGLARAFGLAWLIPDR